MKAKLTISSFGDDWKDCVRDDFADMTVNKETTVVAYKIDGDECSLVLSPSNTIQRRKGQFNATVKLSAEGESFCEFSDGNLVGGYKIQIKEYKFIQGPLGCTLKTTYFSGEDKEEITLKASCLYKR